MEQKTETNIETTFEDTFENAKVGDSVWDFIWGYGRIIAINNNLEPPMIVKFNNKTELSFKFNGCRYTSNECRTLFWEEIQYEVPCRPKRKVKKIIAGWINIYLQNNIYGIAPGKAIYPTEKEANEHSNSSRLGNALYIEHDYEVKE